MAFPKPVSASDPPIFTCYCIDFRYDALSSEFLKAIGYGNSYFLATNAGAALPLGYKGFCKNECCSGGCKCDGKCDDKHKKHKKSKSYCKSCPKNPSLDTLKESFTTNLLIALTLQPINTVYLLNHQDCGAIRAFLPCSGYPASGESMIHKEICINAKLLTYSKEYVQKEFENMQVVLGLIDSNGSVADYDPMTKKWVIIYVGTGKNKDALWYGRKKGEIISIPCTCC